MEEGKNSVIYMGLVLGPNKADNIFGKTNVMGRVQRGSTVYAVQHFQHYTVCYTNITFSAKGLSGMTLHVLVACKMKSETLMHSINTYHQHGPRTEIAYNR